MRTILAAIGLMMLATGAMGPAMAQQVLPPDATFAQEFSGLNAAIESASVARQHVAESARALISDWAKRGAELNYWHRWIEGEKAAWAGKPADPSPPAPAIGVLNNAKP